MADYDDDKLYAYNLATKQRDYDKEFGLHADNSNPMGIWSDGTTIWVANSNLDSTKDNDQIYAYNLTTKVLVSTNAFSLDADNIRPAALWSDGTTMWIAVTYADKFFAYKRIDGSRNNAKDISIGMIDGRNPNIEGIWSDGTTL